MIITRRNTCSIFIVLILGAAVVWFLVSAPISVIGAYDGPVAEIVGVDHDYPTDQFPYLKVFNNRTAAGVDPGTGDLIDLATPCGVRIEIMGLPNVGSYEKLRTIDKSTDEKVEKWDVYKVKCTMSITLSTWKGGIQSLYRTDFQISLQQNEFSGFQDADESTAYILNVYTTKMATVIGAITVQPIAGGYDFPKDESSPTSVEEWILDSGYTQNLGLFEKFLFTVSALDGAPTNWMGIGRAESSATLEIGLDVLLFGHWEQTKDNREWQWPLPLDLLGMVIFALCILAGLILTAVIIAKAPNKFGVIAIMVVWVILAWPLGVYSYLGGLLGIGTS